MRAWMLPRNKLGSLLPRVGLEVESEMSDGTPWCKVTLHGLWLAWLAKIVKAKPSSAWIMGMAPAG